MQKIPFIDLFIDLFESALHVSGDKLAHLQEHFLTYTQSKSALHVSGNKLAHLQEHFLTVCTVKKYSQKVLLKMGEFVARNM